MLNSIKYLSASALLIVGISSCDEVPLPNPPTVEVNAECDTVFSFSAATSSDRNVLVEDFTGHQCGYCPGASYEIDLLHATYGDQLVSVALHPNTGFNEVSTPDYPTDWRIEEAEQIAADFSIPASLPRLMINRTISTPPFYIYSTAQLNSEVSSRMGQTSDFAIKADWNLLTDRTVCGKIEIELLSDLTGTYKVVNYLVEDSIYADQHVYAGVHPNYSGGTADHYGSYLHRHVLRDVFGHLGLNEGAPALSGNVSGDDIQGSLNIGDLKQYVISLPPIPASWNEEQISIVTFVYDDTTKEVMQVVATHSH